ncbi:hypothetical protein [Sphingomonas sp. Ag1]|uniref:hypothetical protein n=1 Tax=Sphingomonas sp. Ag1 TaxID=1642949 RepID=UPI0006214E92|nr:hypothetical protein [Sphingomonas sp. Ag1]KKI17506.1 hypothetical protein XM50_14465 [Sphingomonas sp. Ag1]
MIRTVEVTRIQQRARIVTTGGLAAVLLALPLPLPGDAQAVSTVTIASQSIVGVPSLAAAAMVAPAVIAGDALVHVPAVAAGAAAIGAPAILPASIVTAPIVAAVPAQAITAPAIAATVVVRGPSIAAQGAATVTPALLTSGSVVRAPAIAPGAVSLAPAGLPSTAIVRAPDVVGQAAIINPAPFAFVQDTNITPGQGRLSTEITLDMAGSTVPVTVTVSGEPGSVIWKNGVDIGPGPTTGIHGDRFRVSHYASTLYSTTTYSTLTAGTISATYSCTTKSEAVASLDPDTQAFLSAMSVQPTAARTQLYDEFIRGLKTDDLWAKIDWLTIMAAHDEQAARINVRSPLRSLTAVNSPTFKPDLGFAGGGSAYLHTGEPWVGPFTRMQRNSGTLFIRMTEEVTTGDTLVIGNMSDWANAISVRSNNGTEQYRVHGGGNGANPSTSKLGTRIASRTSANLVSYYVNGSPNGTSTPSSSSTGSSNGTILRVNSSYSPGTIGVAGSASGLSDGEAMALHARIQTFFTAIGVA